MDIPAVINLFDKGFHPGRIFATYQFDDISTGKKRAIQPGGILT
jgi:hypothetical protein